MKNLSTAVTEALGKENTDLKTIKNSVLGLVFAGQVKTVSDKSDIDLVMAEILNEISLQAEKLNLLLKGDELKNAVVKVLKTIKEPKFSLFDDVLDLCKAVSKWTSEDDMEVIVKAEIKNLDLKIKTRTSEKEKNVPFLAFKYLLANQDKSLSEVFAQMNLRDLDKGLYKYEGVAGKEVKVLISEAQIKKYFETNLKYLRMVQKAIDSDEKMEALRKAFK